MLAFEELSMVVVGFSATECGGIALTAEVALHATKAEMRALTMENQGKIARRRTRIWKNRHEVDVIVQT